MPTALFYIDSPEATLQAPEISGKKFSGATQYERIYDVLRGIASATPCPIVAISSNATGISVGPSVAFPTGIQLNEESASFGEADRVNYRGCSSRTTTARNWMLHIDYPAWVALEPLDAALLDQGDIFLDSVPDFGLESIEVRVSSRKNTHPKASASDSGTSVSYSINAINAEQQI